MSGLIRSSGVPNGRSLQHTNHTMAVPALQATPRRARRPTT